MEGVLDQQIASLRALARLDDPETPYPAAGASGASPAAPAALISTIGTIQDIGSFPPSGDPYLPGCASEWVAVLPGTADNCGAPHRAVKACGCESKAVRDHCDKKSCEHNYCVDRNRKRRAADIEDRMEHSRRGRALIYTVFTVPPSRREAAAERVTLKARKEKPNAAKAEAVRLILAGQSTPTIEAARLGIKENSVKRLVKKARDGKDGPAQVWRWQLWMAELVQYLKDELGFDYGCERSDPAGGEHPDRWHPHVNMLWIRKNGHGYLSPEELGLLKARWKEIVGEDPERPISIWTAFAQDANAARRAHWYSYQGRTWPAWEEKFPYHCRIKWLGKPEKAPERETDPCCPKCQMEIACVRTGSPEAAAELAARGYAFVLATSRERIAELKRMAVMRKPAEWQKRGCLVIDLDGRK